MGYAKLYAKAIKKEAKRKEELWLSFFRRLLQMIPKENRPDNVSIKGFYQYLERNELKNKLLNTLEEKAEMAYKNNTMAADELRAALINLESFYNKQIKVYLASKQSKHRLL